MPAELQWSVSKALISVCQLLVGMFLLGGHRSAACVGWRGLGRSAKATNRHLKGVHEGVHEGLLLSFRGPQVRYPRRVAAVLQLSAKATNRHLKGVHEAIFWGANQKLKDLGGVGLKGVQSAPPRASIQSVPSHLTFDTFHAFHLTSDTFHAPCLTSVKS